MLITNPDVAVHQNKWAVITETNADQLPDDAVFIEYSGSVNVNVTDMKTLCWRPASSESMADALGIKFETPVCQQPKQISKYGADVPTIIEPAKTKTEPAKTAHQATLSSTQLSVYQPDKLAIIIREGRVSQDILLKWAEDTHMKTVRQLGNEFGVKGRSKADIVQKIMFMKAQPTEAKPTETDDRVWKLAKQALAKMDMMTRLQRIEQLIAD